jgi:hypothetical protein
MNTEKDTCQKSGTSVIFQKEITQCRNVPIVESLLTQTLMTGSMTMMKKRFVKKLEIN